MRCCQRKEGVKNRAAARLVNARFGFSRKPHFITAAHPMGRAYSVEAGTVWHFGEVTLDVDPNKGVLRETTGRS